MLAHLKICAPEVFLKLWCGHGSTVLELSCNRLEGAIPVELANLTNLETLAVNANDLNGSIPTSLADIATLARLDVSNNSLTGNIPDSFARLSHLVYLDVSHNFLVGPVPSSTAPSPPSPRPRNWVFEDLNAAF